MLFARYLNAASGKGDCAKASWRQGILGDCSLAMTIAENTRHLQ